VDSGHCKEVKTAQKVHISAIKLPEFDIQNCHRDLPGPIVRKNLQNYPTHALPRHYQFTIRQQIIFCRVNFKRYQINEKIDKYRKSG